MHNSTPTLQKPLSEPTPSNSGAARVLLGVLHIYQRLTAGRIAPCRFYPSCSNYAVEAIRVHGALRGGALATRRVLRCRPFGPHGIDLVPEPQTRSPHSCAQ
ncbi:MAG: membrane protein insertion efficiency factor YidD [Acidimicrobiales bacterium]